MIELESIWLEFYVYVDKFPRQLLHDIEIEFIVLNLAFQNQVYYTRDDSFLNSFKNVLTNEYVWKMVLSGNFGRKQLIGKDTILTLIFWSHSQFDPLFSNCS